MIAQAAADYSALAAVHAAENARTPEESQARASLHRPLALRINPDPGTLDPLPPEGVRALPGSRVCTCDHLLFQSGVQVAAGTAKLPGEICLRMVVVPDQERWCVAPWGGRVLGCLGWDSTAVTYPVCDVQPKVLLAG